MTDKPQDDQHWPKCPVCGESMRWDKTGFECMTVTDGRQCEGKIWIGQQTKLWARAWVDRLREQIADEIRRLRP